MSILTWPTILIERVHRLWYLWASVSSSYLLRNRVILISNKVQQEGETPLHWTIRYWYNEVMDMYFSIRDAQSNWNILEGNLLLCAIRFQKELIALEILHLQGFRLAINPQGDHPLQLASGDGLSLVVASYDYKYCEIFLQMTKITMPYITPRGGKWAHAFVFGIT